MQAIIMPVVIVSVVGALSGLLLTVAAKFMAVPVDERVSAVRGELPGANCGACGYAGCDEYAEKLVNEGVKTNLCIPGGGDVVTKISEILGVAAEEVVPMTAIVRCSGTREHTVYIMEYEGPKTCEACNFNYQGRGSCSHSCLGFGDCVVVCQYGAIRVENGVAKVEKSLCVGCGMCAKACPNNIIQVVPASSEVYVACSSNDKGAFVRKVCKAGCIGCKRCEKACQSDAVTVTDNLAVIDPAKCTNCGACVEVCPNGTIKTAMCAVQAAI